MKAFQESNLKQPTLVGEIHDQWSLTPLRVKTAFRGFVLITVIGGMALLTDNAQCTDDVLPPVVKALIGLKIPAKAPGRRGEIPGWEMKGGMALEVPPDSKDFKGVEELYRDDLSIFIVDSIDRKDKSTIILDAKILPRQFLNYDIKNGKMILKKNAFNFYSLDICERADSEIIVGLMRPEPGKEYCTHISKQVKQAWIINPQTGHISEISTQGVSCRRMDADDAC